VDRKYREGTFWAIRSDLTVTPNQRFWVGEIVKIALSPAQPDINAPDPDDIPGSPYWLKIWWCDVPQEFGDYYRMYHDVDGVRVKSMSWEAAEDANFLFKLQGMVFVNTIQQQARIAIENRL